VTTSALQRLVDQANIFDLINTYSDYLDRADVDGLVGLFAPQGLMDMGGGAVHRGKAELRELFLDRCRLYQVQTLHFSGSRLTAYDGSTASVTSSLYSLLESRDQRLGMHTWGRYVDEVILVDGRWLFLERHLLVAAVEHVGISDEIPTRFNRLRRKELPVE
jgi:hypothetical protein